MEVGIYKKPFREFSFLLQQSHETQIRFAPSEAGRAQLLPLSPVVSALVGYFVGQSGFQEPEVKIPVTTLLTLLSTKRIRSDF